MNRAIIYIASGKEYIEQAIRSSKSLSTYTHYDRVLCIPAEDSPLLESDEDFEIIFTLSDRESPHWYVDSIGYFLDCLELPYDELLYLDTDTFCCGPIDPFFEVLRKFDIAGTHAIAQETIPNKEIPASFPELHIGSLAFKNNARVMWLFEDWLSVMEDKLSLYKDNDQAALREALWTNEEILLGILPQEFCFRFRWGGLVSQQVRVLHGKEHSRASYEEMAHEINSQRGIRVWQRRELA